jgi:hypothetical protein
MNSLTRSTNPQIISMLTEDFKYLNIEMPSAEKISKEEEA